MTLLKVPRSIRGTPIDDVFDNLIFSVVPPLVSQGPGTSETGGLYAVRLVYTLDARRMMLSEYGSRMTMI